MRRNIFITLLTITLFLCGPAHAQPGYEQCVEMKGSHKRIKCFEPYFKALTREKSATAAIAEAKAMREKGIINDCHMVAHMVGQENLYKHNYDLGKSLATCPMDCIQGCIHSSVQNYIAEKIDKKDIANELSKVCANIERPSELYTQCVHGVGHGFLTGNYMTLPEAIKACEKFESSDISTCLGGVTMENMQHHLLLSEDDLKKKLPTVCALLENSDNQVALKMCYSAIGEGLMFYTAQNLEKALSLCPYASTEKNRFLICAEGAYEEAISDNTIANYNTPLIESGGVIMEHAIMNAMEEFGISCQNEANKLMECMIEQSRDMQGAYDEMHDMQHADDKNDPDDLNSNHGADAENDHNITPRTNETTKTHDHSTHDH